MQLRIRNITQIWIYTLVVVGASVLLTQISIHLLHFWLGEGIFAYRYMIVTGTVIPVVVAVPVAYAMARILHSLNRSQETLTTLAETDGLTGLINRRCFFERAEGLLSDAQSKGRPVTLLVLDADHFKQLNDRYGHAVGDQALQFISSSFQSVTRSSDLACRLGGEEFAILAPDTDLMAAHRLADRLIKAVSSAPMCCDGSILELSVSCGYADTSRGYDVDRMYRIADEAMYAAKSNGRNRAVQAA
jgi:diguanylate cyclase (GGDEF)-like protein